MISNRRMWLPALALFAGAIPLGAGDFTGPGFENGGDWRFSVRGRNLEVGFDEETSQEGRRSITIALPNGIKTDDGESAGISQSVELTMEDKGISFWVKDDYMGDTANYHWMELLLDGEVIWEADVAGGTPEWRAVKLDLTRYLGETKRTRIGRDLYITETDYEITFRLMERKGVTRFGVQVWADNFKLLKETPGNPQNCEKKKSLPKLRDLMVYDGNSGRFQPVKNPEHFRKKREQIIEGMLLGMGDLPDRPWREHLEGFNIRELDRQVRGRYTKRTIQFDVAEGELVHAFL